MTGGQGEVRLRRAGTLGGAETAPGAVQLLNPFLHARVLKLLDDNPQGCTCEDVVLSAGLGSVLASERRKHGQVSPVALLKQVAGVRCEVWNGQQLFFLGSDSPLHGPPAAAAAAES
eukprot:3619990-Rhodomonas_salina.3